MKILSFYRCCLLIWTGIKGLGSYKKVRITCKRTRIINNGMVFQTGLFRGALLWS
jgi:hypothetical protein